jgi:hypothetical protein
MNALKTHNTKEFPLIEDIKRREWHYLSEFIQDLDRSDPDVIWAHRARVSDIINSGHVGQDMADKVDNNNNT